MSLWSDSESVVRVVEQCRTYLQKTAQREDMVLELGNASERGAVGFSTDDMGWILTISGIFCDGEFSPEDKYLRQAVVVKISERELDPQQRIPVKLNLYRETENSPIIGDGDNSSKLMVDEETLFLMLDWIVENGDAYLILDQWAK